MGKLTKLNKDLFNLKNIKEVIKKSVQVVGLTSALFMGGMGLTGCQHDIPYEPEEPTIEQPVEKPTEKPEEKDHCELCNDTQDEKHGHCTEPGCEKNGVYDDYANEHGDAHDYCGECKGDQTKEHGHCTEPGCEKNGVYDDYANEHGNTHVIGGQEITDTCNCEGIQDEKHAHCTEPGCEKNGVYDDYANKHGDAHDYCGECEGDQTKDHGHCTEFGCEKNGVYDDYANEHGDAHDYCGECEGDQTKDHAHCNIEGCEKEGEVLPHTHDFCGKCDGDQETLPHTCPPETDICDICEGTQTDASHYFHVETIGGEGSAYKVAYPDYNKYFDDNYDVQAQRLDPQKMMQDFQDNYENYINSLEFSDEFKAYCADKGYQTPADIDFKTFDEYTTDLSSEYTSYKNNFDYLIGSTTDDYNKSINDICKPIFEDITKNIKTENASLDKKRLYYYFRALSIHNLKSAYSLDFEISDEKNTYDTEKSAIISGWDAINQDTTSPIENIGTDIDNGCYQITEQMSSILAAAANQMGVELSDLQNMVNLANVMESLTSTRSITKLPTSHSHEDACPTNTMADTIKNAAKTASIQNTSGIEYC